MAFFAVLFGFSCIHLRNFCVVDSATHMNVFPVCSWSAPNRSGPFRCSLRRVVVCICVGAYINNGKQQENREDPTTLTHTHTRIMTKNAFCGTVDMLPPATLLPPYSCWGLPFLAGLLCKSYAKISKTMSHDSSLLLKIVRQPCATSCCIKHRTSLPLPSCSQSQSDSRSAVTIHPFPFPLPNPFPNPSLSLSLPFPLSSHSFSSFSVLTLSS